MGGATNATVAGGFSAGLPGLSPRERDRLRARSPSRRKRGPGNVEQLPAGSAGGRSGTLDRGPTAPGSPAVRARTVSLPGLDDEFLFSFGGGADDDLPAAVGVADLVVPGRLAVQGHEADLRAARKGVAHDKPF